MTSIVVVTDEDGDQAIYKDGVLVYAGSVETVYAGDITAEVDEGIPVTFAHWGVKRLQSQCWPKSLSDLEKE